MEEKELKEILMKKSEEFRKTCEQHQKFDNKLEALKKKGFLSDEERIKERELKKKKLALKDKMYYMMTEFRKSLP